MSILVFASSEWELSVGNMFGDDVGDAVGDVLGDDVGDTDWSGVCGFTGLGFELPSDRFISMSRSTSTSVSTEWA